MENLKELDTLIVEFMGGKHIPDSNDMFEHFILNERRLAHHQINYLTSWDWLMPVVEKIETTQWDITKDKAYQRNIDKFKGREKATGYIFVSYDDREEFKGWFWNVSVSDFPTIHIKDCDDREDTKIKATYLAVVNFIQWYNKQKV